MHLRRVLLGHTPTTTAHMLLPFASRLHRSSTRKRTRWRRSLARRLCYFFRFFFFNNHHTHTHSHIHSHCSACQYAIGFIVSHWSSFTADDMAPIPADLLFRLVRSNGENTTSSASPCTAFPLTSPPSFHSPFDSPFDSPFQPCAGQGEDGVCAA